MNYALILGAALQAAAGSGLAQDVVARTHPAEAASRATGIASEAWWSTVDATGVQRVHVECGSDFIDPPEIVVRSGLPVALHVRAAPGPGTLEFGVAGHGPPRGIGRAPTAFLFTPASNGLVAMACRPIGTGAAGGAGRQGKLHVVQRD